MLVSLSQWELCIDFEGSKMKAQVRYLGLYILVINNKYWLLSWQVLKIIFPILQVTKIKAERLNALCSATGEEHWRTKRLRELLTVNSELNLPEIWQIEQAADQKGGIYWLKSQRNALRSLVDWVKHGIKKGQETFPCIETAVCVVRNEGVEEPLQSQDFKGVGALAGDPDLHVHYWMRFDKVMHCFTGTVGSKIAMCRYRSTKWACLSGILCLGRLRLI